MDDAPPAEQDPAVPVPIAAPPPDDPTPTPSSDDPQPPRISEAAIAPAAPPAPEAAASSSPHVEPEQGNHCPSAAAQAALPPPLLDAPEAPMRPPTVAQATDQASIPPLAEAASVAEHPPSTAAPPAQAGSLQDEEPQPAPLSASAPQPPEGPPAKDKDGAGKRVLPQRRGRGQRTDSLKQAREGPELVGMRVQVWWALDKRFYNGTIERCEMIHSGKFSYDIKYDDGDGEEGVLFTEYSEIRKDGQTIVQVRYPLPDLCRPPDGGACRKNLRGPCCSLMLEALVPSAIAGPEDPRRAQERRSRGAAAGQRQRRRRADLRSCAEGGGRRGMGGGPGRGAPGRGALRERQGQGEGKGEGPREGEGERPREVHQLKRRRRQQRSGRDVPGSRLLRVHERKGPRETERRRRQGGVRGGPGGSAEAGAEPRSSGRGCRSC